MTWQPIETAPEDEYVLLWCPHYFCWEYSIGMLCSEQKIWLDYGTELPLVPPSHWMHLPDPPEK